MPARRHFKISLAAVLSLSACAALALGQAGRRNSGASRDRAAYINVTAAREDGSPAPLSAAEVALYDDGLEQKIQSFTPDPGPARIVLLVDNSLSLRTDVPKLAQMAREFVYEIYEGDQLLVVGYDENAEIITDWTDDAKKVEQSLAGLRKKGQPRLFDAISAVIEEALRPLAGSTRKRAIVVI